MAVPENLEVTLTRDRFKKPLVTVESSIGNGMDASPGELRALAAALLRAADDADARPTSGRYFVLARRRYEVRG